jgi:hypothetical protein
MADMTYIYMLRNLCLQFLLCFLLCSTSGIQPARAYDLIRDYSGPTFFEGWDFYGGWDNLTLGKCPFPQLWTFLNGHVLRRSRLLPSLTIPRGNHFFHFTHALSHLGDVWWLNAADAFTQRLAYINSANRAIIKVDNLSNVPFNQKRNTVSLLHSSSSVSFEAHNHKGPHYDSSEFQCWKSMDN